MPAFIFDSPVHYVRKVYKVRSDALLPVVCRFPFDNSPVTAYNIGIIPLRQKCVSAWTHLAELQPETQKNMKIEDRNIQSDRIYAPPPIPSRVPPNSRGADRSQEELRGPKKCKSPFHSPTATNLLQAVHKPLHKPFTNRSQTHTNRLQTYTNHYKPTVLSGPRLLSLAAPNPRRRPQKSRNWGCGKLARTLTIRS